MVPSRAVASRTRPSPDVHDPGEPKRRAFVAALIGAILSTSIILANSRGAVGDMTFGDGLIYRYVAANLDRDPGDVHPVVEQRGTSLRYGRIGLPATIWIVSAGRPSAMRYTQPLIMVISAAGAAAAAALLFPGAGPFASLVPFIAPGFPLAIAGGYAEALGVALALWAVVFALRRRWIWCAVMLAWAILTRENAGAVLAGIVAWMIWRGPARRVPIVVASLAPVAGWWAFVRGRYGHIPPLDPYLRVETDTVGTPLAAIVRSFTDAASVRAATMAAFHVALAVAAVALARRSLFGLIAAILSLQVLVSGPFAWRFIGEAARTGVFLQVFVALAIVAWRRPTWADPGGLT
jgi:hypothetical protein